MKKGIYINDSIHGLISLSEYEKRIISSIGFNRLHDVYQNSTVYLTFPSNRTKRFEHSIGTMKLCSDMFFSSVLNTEPETLIEFYKRFEKKFERILEDIAADTELCNEKLGVTPEAMPQLEFDKFRNSLIPNNVPDQYQVIHLLLIQSIRAAGLLHDVGHPPFSHIVEEALKGVYEDYKDLLEMNEKLKSFISVMSKYFGGSGNKPEEDKPGKHQLHEQMGIEISENILREIISKPSDEGEHYAENLFEVMLLKIVIKIFKDSEDFAYLHRIIDSSLDGDRLDYVTRDSVNSGIDAGKIGYRRIVSDMQIVIDDDEIYFCAPLKAVNSIEDFIKRRYNIYKDIIYHHRVIKTDFLLEHTVKGLVEKYLTGSSEIRQSRAVIPFDISGLWFPLGNATVAEKSNALSQWNDSWLMTVLKQIYYTEYYRKKTTRGTPEYILSQQLSELLRNTKCYYSLIKRSENFMLIDDAAKRVLMEKEEEIESCIGRINTLASARSGKPGGGSDGKTELDIKGTLDFICKILGYTARDFKGFLLTYILKHGGAINIKTPAFKKMAENIVQEETKKAFTNTWFYGTITIFEDISIGLKEPIYFYDYAGKPVTLDEISGVKDILELDSSYLPTFYIYVLLKEEDDLVKNKREPLLSMIGEAMGREIKKSIRALLKERIRQMEV